MTQQDIDRLNIIEQDAYAEILRIEEDVNPKLDKARDRWSSAFNALKEAKARFELEAKIRAEMAEKKGVA